MGERKEGIVCIVVDALFVRAAINFNGQYTHDVRIFIALLNSKGVKLFGFPVLSCPTQLPQTTQKLPDRSAPFPLRNHTLRRTKVWGRFKFW